MLALGLTPSTTITSILCDNYFAAAHSYQRPFTNNQNVQAAHGIYGGDIMETRIGGSATTKSGDGFY